MNRILKTRTKERKLPLFLPVYQPKSNLVSIDDIKQNFSIDGLIVNGFFLYKDAETKKTLLNDTNLHDYIGFDGVIMTDSGAFQGFRRPLYLSNKKIVKFQDAIGADIVSPLDHISPPWDNFTTAEKKLKSTTKRIIQAKALVKNGILAGVQQGGKFLKLRQKSIDDLMEIGVDYVAIGSLVPFFNKKHDLKFVIDILQGARNTMGEHLPMHVYGAGDPVELPFFVALGADIFDSSSYGHYAIGDWYMTLYGALKTEEKDRILEYDCDCQICKDKGDDFFEKLKSHKNLAYHNLSTILKTINQIRTALKNDELNKFLEKILVQHEAWFDDSQLAKSWNEYHGL